MPAAGLLMGVDARAHLGKAKEFLEAAHASNDLQLFNAATANAVTSGIHAKDAICLTLTGGTSKAESHEEAVRELAASGPAGQALAPTLRRLLKAKTKSQYQASSVPASEATRATEWASRLLEGAQRVTTY